MTINNSGGKVSTSVVPQPDSLSGSTGTMTVRTDGTFDSSFNVNADVIFVKAGTSVTNSANYVGHQAAKTISLSSTNSTYTTTPPSGYPNSATFPSGGIYPRPVHNGPHPVIPSKCGTGFQPTNPQSPTTATKSKVPLVQLLLSHNASLFSRADIESRASPGRRVCMKQSAPLLPAEQARDPLWTRDVTFPFWNEN